MIAWLRKLFAPKPKRIGFRLVRYDIADGLLKQGWTIAKEEDTNREYGFVYLELLEPPTVGGDSA
jgi:hypothetical protein